MTEQTPCHRATAATRSGDDQLIDPRTGARRNLDQERRDQAAPAKAPSKRRSAAKAKKPTPAPAPTKTETPAA